MKHIVLFHFFAYCVACFCPVVCVWGVYYVTQIHTVVLSINKSDYIVCLQAWHNICKAKWTEFKINLLNVV